MAGSRTRRLRGDHGLGDDVLEHERHHRVSCKKHRVVRFSAPGSSAEPELARGRIAEHVGRTASVPMLRVRALPVVG